MAWRKAPPGSLPCYTFGSMYRDNQDVSLARKVAKMCGQSHQVITTGREFLSQFAHYAARSVYLTDACVDLSRSPDLYVNEKVREIAPVRMVGTYGSEMLLHAVMFKAEEPAPGLFQPELVRRDPCRQEDVRCKPSMSSGYVCCVPPVTLAPLWCARAGADSGRGPRAVSR